MVRLDVDSLEAFCRDKLGALEARRQRRALSPTERRASMRVVRGGRELIDFSSNDALGLAHHPRVVDAAADAARRYGASAASSRLVSGNHPLFAALEARLAAHKRAEAALVVSSGYLANLALVPALVGPGDVVVIDALAHACLFAGARLSGAEVVSFAHNDVDDAGRCLAARRLSAGRRCVLLAESVYSMDGDRAPLEALSRLAQRHGAWLVVDDAHGFLVSPDAPTTCDVATIVTGSLSKATASVGGYLAGPRLLVELLTSRARPLVYSTGLPPSAVAAASAALDVVDEEPERSALPLRHARRFAEVVGLPAPRSHIVPLVVGAEDEALALMQGLDSDGFLAVAIRPPTVPAGTSRVRLSFSAGHSTDDVDALAAAVVRRRRAGASLR